MRARPVSCCFSGHRPSKLPWGGDESDPRCTNLKRRLWDAMEAAYASAGILVDDMEVVTVNFLGEERAALHTIAVVQNVPYYTLQFFDFDLGAYSVTLTLASYEEDNTMSLADLFYAVD